MSHPDFGTITQLIPTTVVSVLIAVVFHFGRLQKKPADKLTCI